MRIAELTMPDGDIKPRDREPIKALELNGKAEVIDLLNSVAVLQKWSNEKARTDQAFATLEAPTISEDLVEMIPALVSTPKPFQEVTPLNTYRIPTMSDAAIAKYHDNRRSHHES